MRISSPATRRPRGRDRPTCTRWRGASAAASRSTRRPRPTPPRARTRPGSKSASSSRLITASTFRLKVRGHPAGVVVRRDQPGRRPSPGRCRAGTCRPSDSVAAHRGEEGGALAGSKLPIVEPRNASSRRGPAGQRAEVLLEVADDRRRPRGPGTPRPPPRSPPRAPPGRRRRGRSGERARSSRSACSSSRVFSEVPLPSSTRVSAPVSRGDLPHPGVEDRPLGPGRVVLRQPGDLVEELTAAGVVEVLGRQRLRCRQQPGPDVARHLRGEARRGRGVRRGRKSASALQFGHGDPGGVTSSRCRSGTSTQRASSSQGSLATTTPSGSSR